MVDLALVCDGALERRLTGSPNGTAEAALHVPPGAEVAGVVVHERCWYGIVDLQLVFKDGTRSPRAFPSHALSDYRHGGKDTGGRELMALLPPGKPFDGFAVSEQGSYGIIDLKLL